MYDMEPAPLRTPRGAARDAILAATLRLIADEGIDAVKHRRVAQLAGVSPGSTTHHFAGRDELLREAFRFYMAGAHDLFARIARVDGAGAGDAPIEVVRRVLAEVVEREFADASLVRAEYELLVFASKDAELASDVRAWEAGMVGALAATLERAGAARPVESARTLLNFVRGFELERLLQPTLDATDFDHRLAPLLAVLCADASERRDGEPSR